MFLAKMCCLFLCKQEAAIITIKIPSQLNSLNALQFNKTLQGCNTKGDYCFDFSSVEFAKP